MDEIENCSLSVRTAYQAMFSFLERYYETTNSDKIAELLGSMSMNCDALPMDPACWDEWLTAVRATIESNRQ